ncbi:cbb3-type cytochrome c oxidase subunit I [Marinithermus hydrothermalis]|uniref:Cytochrome c oxidase subunit I n=1 Tax=Marinithermus hydrothermalis (strain DSM 14884 / JCM 11576 / T1) TaxID=869210 RepID=F2NPF5_MARHT|nr:cbb3-type cytochrome c oxidase subunit I [Marinithermus hydrothermalis]AEB12236.1 cytochrome c oxidase subunit I [Marinithermus hydrothermalis DSM 14884]
MSLTAATSKLREGLKALTPGEKRILGVYFALALLALTAGAVGAMLLGLQAAGFVKLPPLTVFKALTVHASSAFFYWLYFVQAGVTLALILAYTPGARLQPPWSSLVWGGLGLMGIGWVVTVLSAMGGAAVLYSAPQPLTQQFKGGTAFLLGYILTDLGQVLVGIAAIATAILPKLRGQVREWSAITFAAALWNGLLVVASFIALIAYVPALQMMLGMTPFIKNFNYEMSWGVMFHNTHYLPLMSTVLVWYVLAEATTGVKSIYGERFSKFIFSLYLVLVPVTSPYHMFLEPEVPASTKLIGSILSAFIGVPTLAVGLIIASSLQAAAQGQGARGLFGWLRYLPWRNPAFSAIGLAPVSALAGGAVSYVLIQERFAPLVSDTFAVPGYFHFFTVGMVSLTFLGALVYMIPALTGRPLWLPSLTTALPYVLAVAVYVFGFAGVWAGYAGVPRRTLDVSFGGDAPALWVTLMSVVGTAGLVMVLVLLAYVAVLAVSALLNVRAGLRVEAFPVANLRPEDAAGQPAWFAPVTAGTLLVVMYAVTWVAFRLMQSLPLVTIGGGGH